MVRGKASAIGAVAAAVLPLAAAPAHAAAPPEATVVPIQVTGDPAKRFNLVIMGDGYTAADMPKFRTHLAKHLNDLWTIEPFASYRSYVNVYAVEIPSGESGVSCDPDLSSPRHKTPLSMGFWGGCQQNGLQRLLVMDEDAAKTYADLVPGATTGNRQILALANSDTYGGAGGTYATASGGNALSALIAPHELGHSLGGLDDEYDYYQRGVPGGTYTGPEPTSIHHTLLTEQEMTTQKKKWWRWLGERSEAGGTIGRYEGGLYSSKGVWRPSRHSMMKTLGYYYDQVGRERMTERISAKVNLVQSNTPTEQPVGTDRVLWVEALHPTGHSLSITWTVDDKPLRNAGANLDLSRLHLQSGAHTVKATVTDPTDFVRDPAIRSSAALTQVRTWTVDTRLETPPTQVPVDFTSTSPTDLPVGGKSVVFAETTHPVQDVPEVRWELDGRNVRGNDRDIDLGRFRLHEGTHRLVARVGSQTRTWTVDAGRPTVQYELSKAAWSQTRPGHTPEYLFDGPFTMRLTGTDDRPGVVVSEFRVDGDGWFNYFGWPTDSQAPFLFTENGTVIDSLTYGKLGKGRHVVEYRAIDSAGNVGDARKFVVTLR
ncbi:M64 family metallopeptidase [Actinomadura roseirufa]|uniref:M64 family metallopeptidase n=1 Tax=Actinomadura roseirufa TaxID=2094049 RepID=UPI0010412B39|nr:M64 family metallopeptidase [Actinomadura roseirufa]